MTADHSDILNATAQTQIRRRCFALEKTMKTALPLAIAAAAVALSGCDMIPSYRVYNARKTGEAHLAEAESSKQIAVQTAKAKWESADYEAKAEVRRAEGVAQANKIIGDSLKNNEAYLRYLFVNNLHETQNQIIYVPTEAGLPILEAGRRPNAPPQKDTQ
jgi:hypothetical protein